MLSGIISFIIIILLFKFVLFVGAFVVIGVVFFIGVITLLDVVFKLNLRGWFKDLGLAIALSIGNETKFKFIELKLTKVPCPFSIDIYPIFNIFENYKSNLEDVSARVFANKIDFLDLGPTTIS